MLKLPNNVYFYWNGVKVLEFVVPASYMGSTCGVCGDFDGSTVNDRTMGDHVTGSGKGCPPLEVDGPAGSQVSSA